MRLARLVRFAAFYLVELVASSVRVAVDAFRPVPRIRPALVQVPLEPLSDVETTVLANLISLTPGTLTVDLRDDGRALLVHSMYVPPEGSDAVVRAIKQDLERRVLEMSRGEAPAAAGEGGIAMTAVAYLSLTVLGVSLLASLVRMVRGPTLADRVAAADLLAFVLIGVLAALAFVSDQPALLDVALVIALVAFLATVAFARYLEGRGAA